MFRQNDEHYQVERDLIMRQIKQLMQLVTRLLTGKLGEYKRDVALDELRRATGDLLRMDVTLLELVDARSAADALRRSDRIALYAHSNFGQAEIHRHAGDAPADRSARRRALQLFIEAALRGSLDDESATLLRTLASEIPSGELAVRYQDYLRDKLRA